MNESPLIVTVARHVLDTSLQASLLAGAVLLAQWTLRRWLTPGWRHALWLLVVIRLLCPALPKSPSSVYNHLPRPTVAQAEPSATPVLQAAPLVVMTEPAELPPVEPSFPVVEPPSVSPMPADPQWNWPLILAVIWAIGFGTLLALMAFAYLRARARISSAPPWTDPTTRQLLEDVKHEIGIRTRIQLIGTTDTDGPALFGLLHKRLLLPRGLVDQFTATELRHVFVHECAHLKRRDVAMNWLVSLLQALHWFNPVLWFAFARMRSDREAACDALAIRLSGGRDRARDYGHTIVRLLERATHRGLVPGLVGINESRSDMKRRIKTIAAFRNPTRWSLLALIPVALLTLTLLTDATPPKAEEPQVHAPNDTQAHENKNQRSRMLQLIRDGKVWFELGEYDKAINALKKALAIEPDDTVVQTYLRHARNGKALKETQELEPRSISPGRNQPSFPTLLTNAQPPFLTHTSKGAQYIKRKLDQIIIPEAIYPGMTLDQVLEDLITITKRHDPEGRGLNFLINQPQRQPTQPGKKNTYPRRLGQPDPASDGFILAPSQHQKRDYQSEEAPEKQIPSHPARRDRQNGRSTNRIRH